MSKPRCVLFIRSDNMAMICSWCEREDSQPISKLINSTGLSHPGVEWAEGNNKEFSHTICESHFKKCESTLALLRGAKKQLQRL